MSIKHILLLTALCIALTAGKTKTKVKTKAPIVYPTCPAGYLLSTMKSCVK